MKKFVYALLVGCISLVAIAEQKSEETYKNTLKWSTASEVDNFGYDIYRSESEAGEFQRVTTEPITGAGTSDLINRYEFTDHHIDPYQIYYYYIESISIDGKRKKFSPVKKAKAKLSDDEGAD